ncbi:NAD(P)H-dependent flavin oxidoreductase [Tardiphaga sp. 215_C5_N2_1]|uniref:NAD(P)H-dependent flavin oxidoreductase n=1 Tax=Tardiphaga sp. 215_C5_N2_1 TaxID=3240774 RepID=UPI003F8937C4
MLDLTFGGRLRLPLIQAPMFLVSTPALALACCSRGVMGSFPAHATRSRDVFADWLAQMMEGVAALENPAPWAVNIVVHPTNARMEGDLELSIHRKVPVILTSKGAPESIFGRIHEYGGVAFHDVASARHAEKAAAAGADALIAVTDGAGGHCGTINPFALLNEIRQVTDKPIILSGAMSTGRDILAAQTMGAAAAYMGTRFIATTEGGADDKYRQLLIDSTARDVFFSSALDGAPANWIKQSLIDCGVDLNELATTIPGEIMASGKVRERYSKVKSCGQGVGMVSAVESAVAVCDRLRAEYDDARAAMRAVVDGTSRN